MFYDATKEYMRQGFQKPDVSTVMLMKQISPSGGDENSCLNTEYWYLDNITKEAQFRLTAASTATSPAPAEPTMNSGKGEERKGKIFM